MHKFVKTVIGGLFAAGLLAGGLQAQAADIKERTIKFAFANVKEHPQGMGAAKFAELVDKKSAGKIKVKLFPGASLGGDLQTLSALQGGTVEMMVLNAGLLSGLYKEFTVFDLPFLFRNAKEADTVVDGAFGTKLLGKLNDKGIVGLNFWDLGFRNVTNSKHPVVSVDDIQGLKIRVVQSPIYIDMFNALGANATPMAFTELYPALEQKSIDGQENPVTVIQANKLNEVQKFLTLTRHTYNPQALIMSKKFWDGLTGDERKLIQEAADEARNYQRQVSRDKEASALADLKKAGMQVNELSSTELVKLVSKTRPVWTKYRTEIGESTVAEVQAELDKLRK